MICIPVVAATQKEALQFIGKSAALADALELRMDLISDGNVGKLIEAVRTASPSAAMVVTNRAKQAVGIQVERERIGVLLDAVAQGVEYVDLELETSSAWREELRSFIVRKGNRTRLIISHHDFHKTPSWQTLMKYYKEGREAGAWAVKIVAFARSPEDNLKVLSLIPSARRRKEEIIAFCMGEQGRISRIMAPLLGSLFTFASLDRGAESAPGQLTVGEMKKIFDILAGKDI